MTKEVIVKLYKQPSFILENLKSLRKHLNKKKSIKPLRKKLAQLHLMRTLRIQGMVLINFLGINQTIIKLKIQYLNRIILSS